MDSPWKSKYASSTSTAQPSAASKTRCSSPPFTTPAVGLLGEAMQIARVRGLILATISSTGNDRSGGRYGIGRGTPPTSSA